LLAYTLKAMHDRAGRDRSLTLDDYKALGGVQGAIAAKLESVLSDPESTAEEARALQRAFTRYLIRVDESAVESERLLRRVVQRASLPQSGSRLIGRLVDAGLLTTKDATIELAHERVIGNWPKLPLNTWLAQDAADRRLIDQLRQRVNDDALSGGLLAQAKELLQRDHSLQSRNRGSRSWCSVRKTRSGGASSEGECSSAVHCSSALAVAVLAGVAWKQKNEAQIQRDTARMELLAMRARRTDTEARSPHEIELAGALGLESINIARKNNWPTEADAIEAARSALIHLPLSVTSHAGRALAALPDGRLASAFFGEIKIWSSEGEVEPVILSPRTPVGSFSDSLALLPDGGLASAGGEDGKIRSWREKGTGERRVLSHGSRVLSLAVLSDGRLASGGEDGRIKLWPKEGTVEPVVLSHGNRVSSLAVLPDGQLASGDWTGKIKLWPKEGTGEPTVLSHEVGVWFQSVHLAVLQDGRLVSGGHDGKIRIWPKEGAGEPVVLPHGGPVLSLAVLPDGRLVSGDNDGKIKIWPKEGAGEPVVLSNGSRVLSLAVLPDGRFASGGDGDGKIRIWPKEGTGEPTVLSHGRAAWSLAVLSDGRPTARSSFGPKRVRASR
jgi:WD40 repeat protein